jgi:hypothetical protein
VLRTRSPLGIATPFDLHVLGTPPAFVLSQDQTLQENSISSFETADLYCLSGRPNHFVDAEFKPIPEDASVALRI